MHRGTAAACRRAEVTDSVNRQHTITSTSPRLASLLTNSNHRASDLETPVDERVLTLIEALSNRVKTLEAEVDNVKMHSSNTINQTDPALETSPVSTYRDERPTKRVKLSHNESAIAPSSDVALNSYEPRSGENASDHDVEDAATVLEFLAWGRLKDSHLTSGVRGTSIMNDALGRPDIEVTQSTQAWASSPSSIPSGSVVALENLHISQIQQLLPTKTQVFNLFEYHVDWLLFMHCGFHEQTFRNELNRFYDEDRGTISMTSTGLQWTALLFSILCGSMTSVKSQRTRTWGFQLDDQRTMARK